MECAFFFFFYKCPKIAKEATFVAEKKQKNKTQAIIFTTTTFLGSTNSLTNQTDTGTTIACEILYAAHLPYQKEFSLKVSFLNMSCEMTPKCCNKAVWEMCCTIYLSI